MSSVDVPAWCMRLHAYRKHGRVCASLDTCLLGTLPGVVSFRSTVDVSARDIAPHHSKAAILYRIPIETLNRVSGLVYAAAYLHNVRKHRPTPK